MVFRIISTCVRAHGWVKLGLLTKCPRQFSRYLFGCQKRIVKVSLCQAIMIEGLKNVLEYPPPDKFLCDTLSDIAGLVKDHRKIVLLILFEHIFIVTRKHVEHMLKNDHTLQEAAAHAEDHRGLAWHWRQYLYQDDFRLKDRMFREAIDLPSILSSLNVGANKVISF